MSIKRDSPPCLGRCSRLGYSGLLLSEVPIITNQSKIITVGLLCAALAVFLIPAVFGVLGVAAGMTAIVKDADGRGALVVTLSAVGAVVGYYWASIV